VWRNGIPELLKDILINYNINGLEDWELTAANDVSDDGQTIVGVGRYNGSTLQTGWVVHIPEPATILLVLGGLCILKRRKI